MQLYAWLQHKLKANQLIVIFINILVCIFTKEQLLDLTVNGHKDFRDIIIWITTIPKLKTNDQQTHIPYLSQ